MRIILTLIALTLVLPAQAEIFKAKFGTSKLTINGDSSVHKWKVETKVVGGFLQIDSAALAKPGKIEVKGKVIIPVRQLKSGKKRMDEVMHAAMNEKKHKLIDFTLSGLNVNSVKDGVANCASNGTIKINGKTKPLIMNISIASKNDQLVVRGSANLKMTDFGIKPPSPKLPAGSIVTKDEIKITFEWVVAR
jgi:polyisoprenoid-binding protein YceI